jgi:hypothetical protein
MNHFLNLRRTLAAGGVLVVLGVAALGVTVVQAQTAPSPSPSPNAQQSVRDRYTQALANRLHVSVDQLKQAMADARKDVGLPDRGTKPAGGEGHGHGFGFAGGRGFIGAEADAVAALFKEDRTALDNELQGKTLAEVAATHGVATQDVVNTVVTTANAEIDRMAQAKNLPADRVSQLKQRISERAQEVVTTHRFPARDTGTRS